ncbi:hypothetical protein DH2020_005411 [Rehmannia glutinosa]|uniref:Phytocyanin domain-containing protein n=1 Tax=Rehmannia glutinosa TaxID=99300 RepID=A0ABR0XG02_REHGL
MASKCFLIAVIVLAIAAPSFATDYVVGDNAGWKLGVNYTAWAEGKPLLFFKYNQGAHNVYRVNGTAFQQCMLPSAFEALTSGNDEITLTTPGKKWYICGVGNHCASGMKLVITVDSGEGPASAPTPTAGNSAASTYHEEQPIRSFLWMLATLAILIQGWDGGGILQTHNPQITNEFSPLLLGYSWRVARTSDPMMPEE